MGVFIFQYPQFIPQVKNWVESVDPFVRRAAAVTFIYSLRRRKTLEHIFEVADALLQDPNIYVLKGYGWMLKEASNHFPQEVFDYVMQKKAVMPRVSLRYAIEKMPPQLRSKAMEKMGCLE